jgi:glycosyltransferase involved in cell wall biosynthesis
MIDWLRTVPCSQAYKIIVPSRFLKKIVTGWRIPEERIQVIYNALPSDAEKSFALPRSEARTLITVCRLVPWKGVDQIIELLPELPSVRLVIAGDGPLRSHLEEIAARLGVEARVVFLGQISQAEVTTSLRKSDAFILNSSYEGLPHVVLEAMAAGVPVVATNVGGTGELVTDGKNGLLVPFGDRAKLKSAISRVLDDPALAARLVQEARRFLEAHLSFRTMVEATEAILKTATQGLALPKG